MTHHLDFSQILSLITKAASIFTFVAISFVLQYFLDLKFTCSCNNVPFIFVFMFVPPFPFTLIAILIKSYYQKTTSLFRCCSFHWNMVCSFILRFIIIYVTLVAVWITTILFDGELYFCLITSYDYYLAGLPCRTNLTSEERRIKSEYYTISQEYGFGLIIGLLLCWNFVKCWRAGCKPGERNYILPYYREVYEDLLSEELNNHLKEELKRIAKEKVKAICNDCITTIEKDELKNVNPEQDELKNDNPEQDELKNDNDNRKVDLEDAWREISSSHFYLTENQPRPRAQRRDPTPGLCTLPPENIQLQILPTEEDSPGPPDPQGDSPSSSSPLLA